MLLAIGAKVKRCLEVELETPALCSAACPCLVTPNLCGLSGPVEAAGPRWVSRGGNPQWTTLFLKKGLGAGGLHMEPKCHRWAAVFWSWVGAQSSWMGRMGRIQQPVLVLKLLVPDNLTEAVGGGRASESGPPELAWGANIHPCPEEDDGSSARKPTSTPRVHRDPVLPRVAQTLLASCPGPRKTSLSSYSLVPGPAPTARPGQVL